MSLRTICLLCLLTVASRGHSQVIVAHRGASFDAPENTLAAFREAFAQQADGVEGDFYLTSDGQIVCIHDKDTERTGGKKLPVAKSTLQQLRQLEYGGWKDARFRGEPLPTFAEVAGVVPKGKLFVIELKTGPEIVAPLKKEIERLELAHEDLLIIAFDAATAACAKELLPDIRAHWLTGFKQNEAGEWQPTRREITRTLQATSADGVGMKGERAVIDRSFIEELRREGMDEFHVWTIDDAADARYFQQLGAVGITTNRPAVIRGALGATGNDSQD